MLLSGPPSWTIVHCTSGPRHPKQHADVCYSPPRLQTKALLLCHVPGVCHSPVRKLLWLGWVRWLTRLVQKLTLFVFVRRRRLWHEKLRIFLKSIPQRGEIVVIKHCVSQQRWRLITWTGRFLWRHRSGFFFMTSLNATVVVHSCLDALLKILCILIL